MMRKWGGQPERGKVKWIKKRERVKRRGRDEGRQRERHTLSEKNKQERADENVSTEEREDRE